MNCCIHCLNCYCFSYQAFIYSQCIDNWHAAQACGLGCLSTYSCCWTLCAPLCIDCKLGQSQTAFKNLGKGCKYFLMGCFLGSVSSLDGFYNCFRICGHICGQDKMVKNHSELIQQKEYFGHRIESCLKLYHQQGPKKIMQTFKP